jgi:hypothetical protein
MLVPTKVVIHESLDDEMSVHMHRTWELSPIFTINAWTTHSRHAPIQLVCLCCANEWL